MPEFNLFKVYPTERARLVELINSRGIHYHSSNNVAEGGTNFECELYFTTEPRSRPIKWVSELKIVFNTLPNSENQTSSAVLLISFNQLLYAASFGTSHFYLSRFSDFEFGIEIASRTLTNFSIKNSRNFSGVRTRTIETYLLTNKLTYDAGEAVNYIKGKPADTALWGKSVSCGQSVHLRKRNFTTSSAHMLCLQLENALLLPVITNIPTAIIVRDIETKDRLTNRLIADMEAGNYLITISQVQLSGAAIIFSDKYEYEIEINGTTIQIDESISLTELHNLVHANLNGDYRAFLNHPVDATEDGTTVFHKPFIHFLEYVDLQENCYLSEGTWRQFDTNYLSNVRTEADLINITHSTEIVRFDEQTYQQWKARQPQEQRYYRERYLNDQLAPRFGYLNRDRNFDLFEGATLEIADLIRGDTIYVVKLGKPQTLNYAIDQATASITALQRSNFEVPVNGQPIRIRNICLWLFFERATHITALSEINSLIFLTKLAQWRKITLLANLQPHVCISYK